MHEIVLAHSLREMVTFKDGEDGVMVPDRRYVEPELPAAAPRELTAWAQSPSGQELVAAAAFGGIFRWTVSTGQLVEGPPIRFPTKWLWYLDAKRVVVASMGPGTNRVLGGGPNPVVPLAQHASPIQSADVAITAGAVVTGSEKGAVLVWDVETGMPLARTRIHRGPVYSVDTVGDRTRLRVLSCSDDGAMVLPLDVVGAARRCAPRELSRTDLSDLETILGGG